MAEIRNLAWHRKMVSRILNYQDGTPDQDFSGENDEWEKLDEAINESQAEERNAAVVDGSSEAFRMRQQFTWSSAAVTFALPSSIDRESIVAIHDVTGDSVGIPVYAAPRWANRKIFFIDNKTLQWATTGPSQDTTLEISYIAEPDAMKEPADEATWLPYNHRHLLNWGAACIAADAADQKTPAAWLARRDNYRSLFHLAISRGSPSETGVPRIRNHRQAGHR